MEAGVVLPLLLFMFLALMQAGFVFYAKSNLNYATFEAARAGTMSRASTSTIMLAFQKGLIPYYGGGRTETELANTAKKVAADVTPVSVRIEILSPTKESFVDYGSPRLQEALKSKEPVIPNVGLEELSCPRDVPKCASDPKKNASGQTLADANLLKLRITYGIPKEKQMPLAGRFYTWALDVLKAGDGDPFKQALIADGRIPVVTHTVMRMQSDAIRNAAMASLPGAGNDGKPVPPGPAASAPVTLPDCPYDDPACARCKSGDKSSECKGDPPITCDGKH